MMRKKVFIPVLLLSLIVTAILTFQLTSLYQDSKYRGRIAELERERSEGESDLIRRVREADELYRSLYYGEIDEDELADSVLYGYVCGTGDLHSEYLNAEQYADYVREEDGDLVGIGMTVSREPDYRIPQVITLVPDAPAEENGVKLGDLIYRIFLEDGGVGEKNEAFAEYADDEGFVYSGDIGYYAAVDLLLGEEGTEARFTVLREDGPDELEEVEITAVRKRLTTVSVEAKMYAGNAGAGIDGGCKVGVIRILSFDGTTEEQFIDAVGSLEAEGAQKFVFDVRSNPGGSLDAVEGVLDYLLPEGPMIRIIDKNGNETVHYSDADAHPVEAVILTDGNTASAAELFSSALRDYGYAKLLGTLTYGKGSMQTIRTLSDGGAIFVTYRKYSPPFSDNYDGIGLVPDIEVELSEEARQINLYLLDEDNDNQLRAAVEELRRIK